GEIGAPAPGDRLMATSNQQVPHNLERALPLLSAHLLCRWIPVGSDRHPEHKRGTHIDAFRAAGTAACIRAGPRCSIPEPSFYSITPHSWILPQSGLSVAECCTGSSA